MVHISHLGNEVILTILRFAARPGHSGSTLWHENLRLIAVCRQWRQILAPIHFNHAVISAYGGHRSTYDPNVESDSEESDTNDSDDDIDSDYESDDSDGGPETDIMSRLDIRPGAFGETISTNLAELESRSNVAPETLTIDMTDISGKFTFAPNILAAMQKSLMTLSRVRCLRFCIGNMPYVANDVAKARISRPTMRFFQALAQMLPTVTTLRFGGIGSCQKVERMLSALVAAYHPQLHVWNSGIRHLQLPNGLRFGQLTHLELGCGAMGGTMMCAISAAPLVCLRLNLIGAAFPWHQFSDNPDYPDHINFARLEQLYVTGTRCLRVDCQQEQAAHPSTLSRPACTIYFPRLQRLSLQQCRTHCSLLEYGVFPQHIPHVSFEGTPGAFALLASSTIGSIGYLELGLCCDQHEPFAGFDMVVSHLCGMAGRSYNVCYVMSPAVLQMDLLQADFYAVTKLELTRLPRIQPLLELASMMPRLNTLVVNCINGEFLRTDPVLAEIIDGTYPLTGFPPITVTVCTLFLNVVRQDYNYVRSLVNCLATCARSLRRMSVDGIPLANPRRNIDEVAHLCPVSK